MRSKVRPLLLPAIAALLGVGMGILAVAAAWRFRPPPVLAAAVCAPLAIHIHSEQAMFQVLVSPGTVGTDSFVLQLMSGDGNLLQVREARMVLSLPGSGIAPREHKAALGDDGYWHLGDVPIPRAGRWHVRIDAVTDVQTVTLDDDFEVPAP